MRHAGEREDKCTSRSLLKGQVRSVIGMFTGRLRDKMDCGWHWAEWCAERRESHRGLSSNLEVGRKDAGTQLPGRNSSENGGQTPRWRQELAVVDFLYYVSVWWPHKQYEACFIVRREVSPLCSTFVVPRQ